MITKNPHQMNSPRSQASTLVFLLELGMLRMMNRNFGKYALMLQPICMFVYPWHLTFINNTANLLFLHWKWFCNILSRTRNTISNFLSFFIVLTDLRNIAFDDLLLYFKKATETFSFCFCAPSKYMFHIIVTKVLKFSAKNVNLFRLIYYRL